MYTQRVGEKKNMCCRTLLVDLKMIVEILLMKLV